MHRTLRSAFALAALLTAAACSSPTAPEAPRDGVSIYAPANATAGAPTSAPVPRASAAWPIGGGGSIPGGGCSGVCSPWW